MGKVGLCGIAALWLMLMGSFILSGCGGSDSAPTEPFPVENYLQSERNFIGNRYELLAEVDSQLDVREKIGRILVVKPQNTSSRLSVFMPDNIGLSIHTGQRYRMDVVVTDKGMIRIESMEKF